MNESFSYLFNNEPAAVSPGLLYRYAENKDALFRLVLLHELGFDIDQDELPLTTRTTTRYAHSCVEVYTKQERSKALDEAERISTPRNARDELATIVGEHIRDRHAGSSARTLALFYAHAQSDPFTHPRSTASAQRSTRLRTSSFS